MPITPIQAKYFAYELTKRSRSDSVEKLATSLLDAKVNITPHQVEAALFAFRSPLSNGAILADEVGLGKTIEAGIVISQKWAERKRKILIIVPANLRKQWSTELSEKFYLNSIILEAKTFRSENEENRKLNPFDQEDQIVICSYHFAAKKSTEIYHVAWDLVVIDEAHRLRNVYKKSNKTAVKIKGSLLERNKILLTATPLQNSLLELYGLVSIIDDYAFGDLASFKTQYAKTTDASFSELKSRLKPLCIRTLRKQVQQYVNYTKRHAILEEFESSKLEWELYLGVSDYLNKEKLYALPPSQKQLMTLVLRKLLASSTTAIQGTLERLKVRLEELLNLPDEETHLQNLANDFSEEFETFSEVGDEFLDEEEGEEAENEEQKQSWQRKKEIKFLTDEMRREIQNEIEQLEGYIDLTYQIKENTKAGSLLLALEKGFQKSKELDENAPQKAIIFTESTRTQAYLNLVFSNTIYKDKIVLFNGTNNDPTSQIIYQKWAEKHKGSDKISGSKSADLRAALVDYFKSDDCQIMIATEAGAEGINLQFCNIVINYDLPWNPQRIEQRIGRCHRYGQKFDVVVVNFLDKNNKADQRVYELLDEKLKLFEGVFGASDEILGAIGSGIDFEKRIAQLYSQLRTPEKIQEQFEDLQASLKPEIDEQMKVTRRQLLENLDEEVLEKLKITDHDSQLYFHQYERWLWELTRFGLEGMADFDPNDFRFTLLKQPNPDETYNIGPYYFGKNDSESNNYRLHHPLAQWIVEHAKNINVGTRTIQFDLTNHDRNVSVLESFKGKSGWMAAWQITVDSFEAEDRIIVVAQTDDGEIVNEEDAKKILALPTQMKGIASGIPSVQSALRQNKNLVQEAFIADNAVRNHRFFDEEVDKLDQWAKDQKTSLEAEIKVLDFEIRNKKSEAKKMLTLEAKVLAQKEIKDLEKTRSEKRQHLFKSQDDIDQQMDNLLARTESRMKQRIMEEELFTIRWVLV